MRKSAAARLLRLWARIPPGAWIFFCCKCCVLSGRGLCDGLIARAEESYRVRCVVVCDLETSWMRRTWPTGGCRARNKQNNTWWSIKIIKILSVRHSSISSYFFLLSWNADLTNPFLDSLNARSFQQVKYRTGKTAIFVQTRLILTGL
jgi:hypothetical protein